MLSSRALDVVRHCLLLLIEPDASLELELGKRCRLVEGQTVISAFHMLRERLIRTPAGPMFDMRWRLFVTGVQQVMFQALQVSPLSLICL